MIRRIFFWAHLSVGLLAGLIIAFMACTGFLLAFERQIMSNLGQPHLAVAAGTSSTQIPIAELEQKLTAGPKGAPTQLVLHSNARLPIEARWGREATLYVDPANGQILGQPSAQLKGFFQSVEHLHRSIGFGMQSKFGRGLAGAACLCFGCLLCSGAIVWLPKVWNSPNLKARLLFRSGLKGRSRDWNWHNVLGAWLYVPLLVLVCSGVVMAYPWATNLLYIATGSQPPAAEHRGGPDGGPGGRSAEHGSGRASEHASDLAQAGPQEHAQQSGRAEHGAQPAQEAHGVALALDPIASAAASAVPGWQSIAITLPSGKAKTVQVAVDRSQGGMPEKVTQLTFDGQSGMLVKTEAFSSNVMGKKLRAWAKFMHTGEEFGLPGQMIAALAALSALVLVWTGFSLSWRRFFA